MFGLVLGVGDEDLGCLGSCWKAYDLLDKFPIITAGRTIKAGFYSSLAFGLVQDALGLARGRRLGYVDFFMGNKHDRPEAEEMMTGR